MKQKLAFFILFLGLIPACKKYEIKEVKVLPWEVDLAAPLVNSTFSVSDVFELNDSTILEYIDEDEGLLGITYSGTIISFDASSIIEIGDQNFNATIQYPDPGLPIPIVDTIFTSQVFTLDFETQNLEDIEAIFMTMLSGFLELTVNSDIAYLTNIQLSIPSMKKNGLSYQFESDVIAGETVSDSELLDNYILNLSEEDLGYNQIRINYRLIINYDPTIPSTGEEISILFHFNEPKLDNIIGYFGQNQLASIIDTIRIELFNNTLQGHFQFIDPRIKININNSFGFPTLIDFTEFKSVNQITGEEIELFLEGLTDAPFEIGYPTQIGDSVLEEHNFDNSNSNIEEILNDGNKYLVWGVDASSNPNGPEGPYNFLTHESKLEISTHITMPLKGYAWDWVFSDTTRIDSGNTNIEDLDPIKELTIRLILDNGFPAEGIVQVYTADSAFQITDSIFDSPTLLLEGGTLVDGIITESAKTITDIELNDDKREHFINARNLITNVMMETTNGSSQEVIQIYDYYSIQIILGIRAKIEIDPEGE